jgi:hypothetical protein
MPSLRESCQAYAEVYRGDNSSYFKNFAKALDGTVDNKYNQYCFFYYRSNGPLIASEQLGDIELHRFTGVTGQVAIPISISPQPAQRSISP